MKKLTTREDEAITGFEAFRQQMETARIQPLVIETFRHYYEQLNHGSTGLIPEKQITPVAELPDAETLEAVEDHGRVALSRAAVLKLNGGLGTSMGLDKAKSLLVAKEGLTFLDIVARQVLALRKQTGHSIPLILMNSFYTEQDTREALKRYPELVSEVPLSFVQNRVPKVLQEGHRAVDESIFRDLVWCPPGHGDLYVALQTSGILEKLLNLGFEYLFVSNSDNLGAVLDTRILGYFVREGLPFLMEVADRTPADSKGGHLARRPDGHLILREVAQCPEEDLPAFSDIGRHHYFNTNNIWLHLPSLRRLLKETRGVLPLPLIRNSKTLDPRDPDSPPVFQLETAMGAAIELFENAQALRVPRSRFAPVKLCSDLLVLWSDTYVLTPDSRVEINPANTFGLPQVKLDERFYKLIDDLEARFPEGAPSLSGCQRLDVEGDIRFGQGIVIRGKVKITNDGTGQSRIPDGTLLENTAEVQMPQPARDRP